MEILFCVLFGVVFPICFDLYHVYAYKRCIRNRKCREWLCKNFHECELAKGE